MAVTCPNCDYQPIGPYIDNCPLCAEPVRHLESNESTARPRSAPPPEGRSLLAWVLIGLGGFALLVLVVIAAGSFRAKTQRREAAEKDALNAVERGKAGAEPKVRPMVVTAAQLLRDFRNDPNADRKYKDEELEITGVVERGGYDGKNTPFVILHAGDEDAKCKIECYFDSISQKDENRIARLAKGQTITVRGEYEGRVGNLQIRECALVK